MQAQDLIDNINDYDDDYPEEDSEDIEEEVALEFQKAIIEELTIPIEDRDIYWAQTLIDSI